jgi:transposase
MRDPGGGRVKTDSGKSYLPLLKSTKVISSGPPLTRKKYTPAFEAECMRQVAAGARQTDVARAQVLSPALLSRWQRQALAEAVPSTAERDEIKRLRAELRRVEQGWLKTCS